MARGDEGNKRSRLEAARRLLTRQSGSAEAVALIRDFFDDADAGDLLRYSAGELAAFAEGAASLLARRPPGRHLVRVTDRSAEATPETIVDIVNDNMAFLVDSVMGELRDEGLEIRLLAHPIIAVDRDKRGRLIAYRGLSPSPDDTGRESLIHIHLPPMGAERRKALAASLDRILSEVRTVVSDWKPMMAKVAAAMQALKDDPPPIEQAEIGEAVAFLQWLLDGNFTFLGLRRYQFQGSRSREQLKRASEPGLGILADPSVRVLRRGPHPVATSPEIRDFLLRPEPLIVSKANTISSIHRRAYMDYVGIKLYRADGGLDGELRVVGLFTSAAYHLSVRNIPYLRRKADWAMRRSGLDPASHSGKALFNVLETYPRDELFQIDRDVLLEFAEEILRLDERPRVRVLVRPDKFDRFVSVLVFVPRDRYSTRVRIQIGDHLAESFGGRVSMFEPTFLEGGLVRVHFIIGRLNRTAPPPERHALESAVEAIIRTWDDNLREALQRQAPVEADHLFARYVSGFPDAYREDFSPAKAAADIAVFEALSHDRPTAAELYRREGAAEHCVSLKVIHLGPPIELTRRVPVLENLGFRVIDENTYRIERAPGLPLHVHDTSLETADRAPIDAAAAGPRLLATLHAQRLGLADSDGLDGLVIKARLEWREVAILRTVSRYLHQAGSPFSQPYIAATLNRHPALAAAIVRLFHGRFALPGGDEKAAKAAAAEIAAGLDGVTSLDEDRIIRRFVEVVEATVRTNFYQPAADGQPKPEIALKLDCRAIAELPEPKPYREIFMSSPRLEALHLRFGKIARGGIRWSDRPEDFRTEVLSLVKAQQVKNAVIVPVGAKGGFVPRATGAPDPRTAGATAYTIFMHTLLDLTDNLDGERVLPPPDVVRQEGDDPYLVVAADKGTATFSDIANGIAEEHGFWLGDAFASGGSAGYDHKAMGITARGAFEAVKRHFREMDVDITRMPFSVAGVGDMSGDVFGNGMMLLPTIRLVAAFDHRDIFLDPDPDPARSLAERRRLFDKPRSSWQDYDRSLISAGGGVFSRTLKAVPLSPEVRSLLGLEARELPPAELIRAILGAGVDLLWFGGIGTFIRTADESDAAIGDRANASLRIAAGDVRAKVIGEGANLGMTERARVEYALAGGRCNSDAIDNSAGVNTSDVEVNIKIAFAGALRNGKLKRAARNRLLASMTKEVAELVLRNNYLQTLAISLAERRGLEDYPFQLRLIQVLEERKLLDRRIEALPDDAMLAERAAGGRGLTRPEISLLLAHAKLSLFSDLLATNIEIGPELRELLIDYFPSAMRERFRANIERHRLRHEIVCTSLVNRMINRGGPTYALRVADRSGAGPAETARAFLIVEGAFGLEALNDQIDALDGKVPGAVQLSLYTAVQNLLIQQTIWFITHADPGRHIAALAKEYGHTAAAVREALGGTLAHLRSATEGEHAAYLAAGVPAALARHVADLPLLRAAPDIHLIGKASGQNLARAAETFFAVSEHFGISRVEELATSVKPTDYYEGLALDRALRRLAEARRRIAAAALTAPHAGKTAFDGLVQSRRPAVARVRETLGRIGEASATTPARVSIAADLLADFAAG